jgi:anti-sigma factor RsiW
MSDLHPPFRDDELHRWVDGRLDAPRAAEIELAMRDDPALARTLRGWREQRDALRALGREGLDEPVPPAMRDRIEAAVRHRRDDRSAAGDATATRACAPAPGAPTARRGTVPAEGPRGRAAVSRWRIAASVALAGGALAGFAAGRATAPVPDTVSGPTERLAAAADPAPPGFVRAAAVAHAVYAPEVRHPVEVAADERAHLVAWLSKRLDAPLRAPELAAEGFELVGGRLLPGERGPSAQLMYQDARGIRVTLYVARGDDADASTAFRFERSGPVQSFYWIDRGLGYALSGEMPRERLSALATAVHRALEAPSAAPR